MKIKKNKKDCPNTTPTASFNIYYIRKLLTTLVLAVKPAQHISRNRSDELISKTPEEEENQMLESTITSPLKMKIKLLFGILYPNNSFSEIL